MRNEYESHARDNSQRADRRGRREHRGFARTDKPLPAWDEARSRLCVVAATTAEHRNADRSARSGRFTMAGLKIAVWQEMVGKAFCGLPYRNRYVAVRNTSCSDARME